MNRRRAYILISLLLLPGLALTAHAVRERTSMEEAFSHEATLAWQQALWIRSHAVTFTEAAVPPGLAFFDILTRAGVDRASANGITLSAQPLFDLRRVRAGNRIALGHTMEGELRAVRYEIDPERALWISASAGDSPEFSAEIKTLPATIETTTATGRVEDSLWNAVIDAGEQPEMAVLLADIFGWDLDFHTETRRGDTFRVAMERKKYHNGDVGYARVLAAEYVNEGRAYRAVLFRDASGKPAYYAPDGTSLQKAFLRSPLKYGAPVTSRFSRRRFHPVLKRHRPHLGVDYGAPYGAPVQAIGDGRVIFAGSKGGAGRMVHIRHANGYETMYLHLSRMFVGPGQRVSQGQRIGLVGSTGLATGPHLDFRITQNGAYRNFEALRLPPAHPVSKNLMAEFAVVRDSAIALLPDSGAVKGAAAPAASESANPPASPR